MAFSNFSSLISLHIPSHLLLRWFQQIDIFLELEMSGRTEPPAATTRPARHQGVFTSLGGHDVRPQFPSQEPLRLLCPLCTSILSLSVHLQIQSYRHQKFNSILIAARVGEGGVTGPLSFTLLRGPTDTSF